MEYKLTFLIIILSKIAFSQCLNNGITTNPSAPVNNQLPLKRNLYFDWRLQNIQSNTTCQPLTLVESPFFKVDNLEILRQSKDMLPEDGWELIRRDFGYTDNNTLKPETPEHTYFILYNKFTGVLRILLKTCRGADYNGMKISIRFDATTLYQSALLDLTSGTRALDSTHTKNPIGQSASVFVNDRTKWFYADFPMNYDPCTCKYKTKLNIISQLIQNSVINLQGSITGTITSIANGAGTVNSSGSYSFKDFVNDADKFKKGYGSVDNFITETKNVVATIPNSASTITALTNFQTELKNVQFLKTGLAVVPWLKAAVGVLDFFTGGGKTAPQTVQIMPMAVNLSVRLSGTMQTSNQYHNITFTNPGSLDAQNDPDIYPFYNEALGVFNLLNTPILLTKITTIPPFATGQAQPFPLFNANYVFKNPLKYVINPSSGLVLQDAQVAFVMESNIQTNPPANFGSTSFAFLEGKDAETGNFLYRTDYIPIQCFANNYQFLISNLPIKPITKFKLKIMLNFKRTNNPTAQNILQVLSYPIKLENTTLNLTGTTFNSTSCPGGGISQANSTDINTFCSSTLYTTNRANRIASNGTTSSNDTFNGPFKISPNPANNFINISGTLTNTKLIKLEIADMFGRIHAIYDEQLQGSFTKSYTTSNLLNGVYVMRAYYSNGETKPLKFIVKK